MLLAPLSKALLVTQLPLRCYSEISSETESCALGLALTPFRLVIAPMNDGAMNLHLSHTASAPAPPDWAMQLIFEIEGATSQCICVISRSGMEMCRLSTACQDSDRGRQKVAEKARAWIADFLARETSNATLLPINSSDGKGKAPRAEAEGSARVQGLGMDLPLGGL